MSESQWITAAKRGDDDALAHLLQENYLLVLKYLLKVTLNRANAEDLTQDTMIRAIQKIHLYDEKQSKFSTWLITIATRLYLDARRKRQRESTFLAEEAGAARNLRWQVEQAADSWPELMDALADLQSDVRTAIILKHYYGYAYDEIAEMMKIPSGTVKSRIHHGLQILRKESLQSEE